MKSPVFAALVLSASLATAASAQVKSLTAAAKPSAPGNQPATTIARARTVSDDTKPIPESSAAVDKTAEGELNHAGGARARRADATAALTDAAAAKTNPVAARAFSSVGHSTLRSSATTKTSVALQNVAASAAIASVPTQIYRVGVGDVLDIQLSGNPARTSTLFTVLENGVLEYPLAGNPVVVSGMTTSEVAALLRQRIKVFDNPNVAVDVRDYASHTVNIVGLVEAPGKKILRREALPLYALLAEASLMPEAGSATITRKSTAPIVVDIKDAELSATLVLPGDAIKVTGKQPAALDFYFVGGEINSPGQKPYHDGITLTQGILASGGMKGSAGSRVKVSRQGEDGKLVTEEFNLRKIQAGKDPDPILQKGDRVEVFNAN
jgi:protein involved in polysaccharide export with SLBB domain